MKKWWNGWKKEMSKDSNKIIAALLFLTIAVIINHASGTYIDQQAVLREVPDLILDNIPPMDLSFFYIWGYVAVIGVFVLYPLLFNPKKLSYSLGMMGIFILIRASFIILTHLKTPVDAISAPFPWYLGFLSFKNDLFFSGHTGLPFLGFLIFRKESKFMKYFMLSASFVLGATVLLMHAHYSIDVISAFFITFGIFTIGNHFYKK